MRKAGAICAFAVAVGCIASLSWPQSAVNRVTVANRVSLLVTVALLVGLWVAGRRLVGPARAGRAQRLVRAGGYSAVLALTLCKVSVERMRGPESLGPGAGGLLWTGEALFLLMMAIFTAVVIMATAQRSPVTTGTLLRGIAAGLPIGIAVFVFLPLGVVRYQASRVLPTVPQGALEALAWTTVLVAPAVAGVLAARRFTSGQAPPPAAGPASGFSARLREGVRAVRGGHGRRGRKRGESTPRRCRRAGGWPDWRHARGVAGHRHDRPAAARQPAAWLAVPAPQSRCHIARGTGRWRQCCGLPASPACCPVRRLRSGIHRRVDRYSGPGPAAGRRHRC